MVTRGVSAKTKASGKKDVIITFDSLWYLSSNNKTVLFFIAVLDADPQDWASKNRMGNTNVPFDSEM